MMNVPVENSLAFFPRSYRAGNVTIGPLTLAGAVRICELGVDICRRVPDESLFQVAAILAGMDHILFVRSYRGGLKELQGAVERALNNAFETFVKPAGSSDVQTMHLTPHGLGWPLEYAEFLCGEYGWSWKTAVETPVVTVFALYAAYRQRHGGRHSIDYIERHVKPIRI